MLVFKGMKMCVWYLFLIEMVKCVFEIFFYLMGKKAIREIDNMSLIKNIFKIKMNNQLFCLIVKTYKEKG